MISPVGYFGHVVLARLLLKRGMAAIYLVAFLTVLLQCTPLIGMKGLLPAPDFLREATFREAPSLFHWRFSDGLLRVVAWMQILISGVRCWG